MEIDKVVLKRIWKCDGVTLCRPAPIANLESETLCSMFDSCAVDIAMDPNPMQDGPSILLLIHS